MPKSATRERTLTFLSLSVPTWRFSEGLIFIVSPNLARRPFTNKQVSNWVLAHTCLGHLLPFSFQFCFMHCETIKAWWSRPRIPWQAFLGPKQQTRSVQVEACRHTFWTLDLGFLIWMKMQLQRLTSCKARTPTLFLSLLTLLGVKLEANFRATQPTHCIKNLGDTLLADLRAVVQRRIQTRSNLIAKSLQGAGHCLVDLGDANDALRVRMRVRKAHTHVGLEEKLPYLTALSFENGVFVFFSRKLYRWFAEQPAASKWKNGHAAIPRSLVSVARSTNAGRTEPQC